MGNDKKKKKKKSSYKWNVGKKLTSEDVALEYN